MLALINSEILLLGSEEERFGHGQGSNHGDGHQDQDDLQVEDLIRLAP